MSRSILTSKGQLTLPRDVREKLGLRSGDRVIFDVDGDTVMLKAEPQRSLSELRGSLPAAREYEGKENERRAARDHVARGVQDPT